jgi:hypothetical protein
LIVSRSEFWGFMTEGETRAESSQIFLGPDLDNKTAAAVAMCVPSAAAMKVIFRTFFDLLLAVGMAFASQWHRATEIGICDHIFRSSQRETARYAQEDPIVVWLGRPSMSLHVEGKYGPLPMPSVWVSFVNVLYVTKCDGNAVDGDDNGYVSLLTEFMLQWLGIYHQYHLRDLYLAGDEDDLQGGKYLLSTAALWSKHPQLHLKGLLLGNPSHAPIISRHFGHRSFETVNNLTSWSIDRARQNIICNSRYAQVDFVMNDYQFHYTPIETSPSSAAAAVEGMHEYQLSSISSYEKCFHSPEEWESNSSPLSKLPYDTLYPTLTQSNTSSSVYLQCLPSQSSSHQFTSTLLEQLLAESLTIVLYSSIYKSSQAICSFYIGIYPADAIEYRPENPSPDPTATSASRSGSDVHRKIEAFNQATLLPYESAWLTATSQHRQSEPKAMIQDGLETLSAGTTLGGGGLVWIQLDSRYAPILGKQREGGRRRKEYEELLHRVSAVDLLAHLLGKHQSPIAHDSSSPSAPPQPRILFDYTDLFL